MVIDQINGFWVVRRDDIVYGSFQWCEEAEDLYYDLMESALV